MTGHDDNSANVETAGSGVVDTKPTFLVIGAGKAGTTTLHSILGTLPDIYMSTPKEIQYFSHPPHPEYPLSRYYEFFAPGADRRHRGESSPTYTMFPTIRGVPERIHAMNPDLRLIYVVREPVARMVSAYAQTRRSGYEFRPIDEALMAELTYTTTSMYALQLSEYLRYFEPEQIHVEDLADLAQDPEGVVSRICAFLEVPDQGAQLNQARNPTTGLAVRPSYGPLLRRLRERGLANRRWQRRIQASRIGSAMLDAEELRLSEDLAVEFRRVFASDVADLEDLLGRSFAHWASSARR